MAASNLAAVSFASLGCIAVHINWSGLLTVSCSGGVMTTVANRHQGLDAIGRQNHANSQQRGHQQSTGDHPI